MSFELAKTLLLNPGALDVYHLEDTLGLLHSRDIDYADLYFQYQVTESWSLEEGIVKAGSFNLESGVGVRALANEKTGFAYSEVIDASSLKKCALAARGIVQTGGSGSRAIAAVTPLMTPVYSPQNPIMAFHEADKVKLLQQIDQYARHKDSRIREVMASLHAVYEVILIADSEGRLNTDVRPLTRLNISIIAEENGRYEQGYAGGGGRYAIAKLFESGTWQEYVDEAIRIALINLKAEPAPAGVMDVVLGPGWPAVLLHEAVGHGLEGDFNRKETSAFSKKIGERVASPLCTVVDNGTLVDRRGSLNMDDEGEATQETVLIENGILKGYLFDKQNARLMKKNSTGNGRRESYAHLPLPRMTNTYMMNGTQAPEEIIASLDKGIYAVNFSGGQVDITSGQFVFVANEAYLVEQGKIIKPLKGVSIIGDGPSALTKISMVGNDLQLDSGVGVCGKEGQSIPVGVGQPTLRINGMTIGGTSHES